MPFIGAIDRDSRIGVNHVLQTISPKTNPDIYVGCSGNFTFDKMAAHQGFNVHSNDVSLYSRLVAAIVQKNKFPVTCTNDELIPMFETWDDTPYTDLIKIMFAMRIGQFAQRKHDYHNTMWNNYKNNANQFFDKTIQNFNTKKPFDFNIASFYYGDFKEHIANAPNNATIFLYAPTYKAGYEKLYSYVEQSFEYERPTYELFDSKSAGQYYEQVLSTKRACIYSDVDYHNLQSYIAGKVTKEAGKHPVYFYNSLPAIPEFHIQPTTKLLTKTPILLQPNDTITDDINLIVKEIPKDVVSHYKHMYMSAKVNYSLGGDYALGFFADNKLFGFAVFSKGLGTQNTWETLFLHSDFTVPSNIDRLSKLLLYLLRSKDTAKLIKRHYVYSYTGLQTSVYTDKPVSMKYRGIFKKESSDPKTNKLTYSATFTELSINECYEKWKNRKPLT